MTRSEFLARFTIQHASVTRAVDFANKLELSEEFEGWDEEERDDDAIDALLAAAEAVHAAVEDGTATMTGELLHTLDCAIGTFHMPDDEDDADLCLSTCSGSRAGFSWARASRRRCTSFSW